MAARLTHQQLGILLVKARQGDHDAFSQLYQATVKPQYFIALTNTHSPALADDVVQEVYIRLYQNMDSIKNPELLVSFLNRINYRCCAELMAKEKPDTREDIDDYIQFIRDMADGPDSQLNQAVVKDVLSEALAKMDPVLSETLIMRHMEDMKIDEIAKALHVSDRTVKRYLQKGAIQLRSLLNQMKDTLFTVPFVLLPITGSFFGNRLYQVLQDAHLFLHQFKWIGISRVANPARGAGPRNIAGSRPALRSPVSAAAALSLTASLAVVPQFCLLPLHTGITDQSVPVAVHSLNHDEFDTISVLDQTGTVIAETSGREPYFIHFGSNGTYTVEVANAAGQRSRKEYQISSIDHQAPRLTGCTLSSSQLHCTFRDDLSGVDFSTLSLTGSGGAKIPYTLENSTISFSDRVPSADISVCDYFGNEYRSQITLE